MWQPRSFATSQVGNATVGAFIPERGNFRGIRNKGPAFALLGIERMTGSDSSTKAVKADLVALIPRLRRFGYALTGSREDGDDIVQVALERALSRLHQWQPGTRLDSWLFRIAHNAWIDEVRARKRRGASVDLDNAPQLEGDDGRTLAAARLDLAQVRAAISTLPEEQRAVLALVAIEGLSYQEAADALEIPIGTVMSRLARARMALAKRLERPETGPKGED
jgi:RNA polymerase sigma-70 factor (ECF subfamily)